MKEPIEYLKHVTSFTTRKELYEIGKQIQIDAYNKALDDVADAVDLSYCTDEQEIPEGTPNDGELEYGYNYIDKNSILKLKK